MPTEDADVERFVRSAVDGGLVDAPREEVEKLLGEQLQREILDSIGSDAAVPQWATATFGPASLARRFIDFHRAAIGMQICAGDGSGLKPEFARLLQPGAGKAGGLGALSAALMSVLHITPPEAAGGGVAVYTAIWMMHADLQQWCLESSDLGTAGLPRE
jgi:hypothetical protein